MAWSGKGQQGKREFEAAEEAVVLNAMHGRVGAPHATTVESLSQRTRVEPRTVRAILSANDGLQGVLVFDESLVYWAEFAEEAEGYTRKLKATIDAMVERVDRRERGAAALLRRQQVLFGG